MYTGHVAVALGARAVRSDIPLWMLVGASQACDWVELLFSSIGAAPQAGLWSHAYPFVVVAACTAAALVGVWKRSVGAALLLLAVYLSHPVADLVTGYKPLWVGGPPLGLHFIERPVPDFLVQGLVCVIGWALYVRSLRPVHPRRWLMIAPLVVLLSLQALSDLIVYVRNPGPRHAQFESRL